MKTLPELATNLMKEWYDEHSDKPYPTELERQELARLGQISESQVKAWFANKRNRTFNTRSKNNRANKVNEQEQTNLMNNFYHPFMLTNSNSPFVPQLKEPIVFLPNLETKFKKIRPKTEPLETVNESTDYTSQLLSLINNSTFVTQPNQDEAKLMNRQLMQNLLQQQQLLMEFNQKSLLNQLKPQQLAETQLEKTQQFTLVQNNFNNNQQNDSNVKEWLANKHLKINEPELEATKSDEVKPNILKRVYSNITPDDEPKEITPINSRKQFKNQMIKKRLNQTNFQPLIQPRPPGLARNERPIQPSSEHKNNDYTSQLLNLINSNSLSIQQPQIINLQEANLNRQIIQNLQQHFQQQQFILELNQKGSFYNQQMLKQQQFNAANFEHQINYNNVTTYSPFNTNSNQYQPQTSKTCYDSCCYIKPSPTSSSQSNSSSPNVSNATQSNYSSPPIQSVETNECNLFECSYCHENSLEPSKQLNSECLQSGTCSHNISWSSVCSNNVQQCVTPPPIITKSNFTNIISNNGDVSHLKQTDNLVQSPKFSSKLGNFSSDEIESSRFKFKCSLKNRYFQTK